MKNPKLMLAGFALLLLVGGLLLGGKGLLEVQACLKAQSWPTTAGIVESSTMDARSSMNIRKPSAEKFDVRVQYHYEVNGQSFTGTRLTFAGVNHNSRSDAEEAVAKYPIGA